MCCCDERKRRNPSKRLRAPESASAPHTIVVPNWVVNSVRQREQRARNEDLGSALALGERTEKKSKALPIALGAIGVGAAVFFLTR